MAHPTARNL